LSEELTGHERAKLIVEVLEKVQLALRRARDAEDFGAEFFRQLEGVAQEVIADDLNNSE
jgi:hypothetical protein